MYVDVCLCVVWEDKVLSWKLGSISPPILLKKLEVSTEETLR